MLISRPMLAATVTDIRSLTYPLYAQPKIDGIRCLRTAASALSRKFKRIPNHHIVSELVKYDGTALCDGELVTYTDGKLDPFHTIQSKVMTEEGQPKFRFIVFDHFAHPHWPFHQRMECAQLTCRSPVSNLLESVLVNSADELESFEEVQLALGYEGVILRDPYGEYKSGRSTLKEQLLLKLKRFVDDEATIIGAVPLESNQNEAELDELGLTKRSSCKAGQVTLDMLGALEVEHPKFGSFYIGSGFTQEQRHSMWANLTTCGTLLGQQVTFKYQPHGMKDKPRSPIFKGIRLD